MTFHETHLKGAFVIELERHVDDRGFFARSWCQREFSNHGLNARLSQCNISFNQKRGTLRGMHFQKPPHAEAKLVRCTMGAIYDAIIDLRPDSATFKKHFGTELTAENRRMLYVPEGFAHGFQTLMDASEVFYQMSEFFDAAAGSGVRWDDPTFGIEWPVADPILNGRDRSYSNFL
ncbi:MAG: dTDP-4-dehydrorhamnose 3,5-epimerase [Verrucomicrobiota bacterium]